MFFLCLSDFFLTHSITHLSLLFISILNTLLLLFIAYNIFILTHIKELHEMRPQTCWPIMFLKEMDAWTPNFKSRHQRILDLPIAYSAVMNQLISGHSSLNFHLFKAKRRLDPLLDKHCANRQTRRKSNLAGITRLALMYPKAHYLNVFPCFKPVVFPLFFVSFCLPPSDFLYLSLFELCAPLFFVSCWRYIYIHGVQFYGKITLKKQLSGKHQQNTFKFKCYLALELLSNHTGSEFNSPSTLFKTCKTLKKRIFKHF
ncbi:hypothetical protein VP01_2417g2 [Puccinia sorghi]|uniref:Uncharacterized protein n=1 Tax=Puccinia sorghi TaxID=27349 RepID=A0A0L6V6H4_9BASI|nr:hypothetical protein VP01_2417g2 [Puccinia sorghi]